MDRTEQARRWVSQQLTIPANRQIALEPVSGDASFRRYFRVCDQGGSRIVMDAPPQQEDCRPYLDITARLRAAGLHAPEVYAEDIRSGFLLLEDLGDDLYRDVVDEQSVETYWQDAFRALRVMASRVDCQGLPHYDNARLQRELDLFPDWYVAKHLGQRFTDQQRRQWQGFSELLIASALEQPQVFVHRDFHSCNLLHTGGDNPGIIDFQDGVLGPVSYDLMSLLLDRYISWPREQLCDWLESHRREVAADIEPATWLRWCDWIGLQRNLKILGIFARLSYRDGKQEYLSLMPRFAAYIDDVMSRYPEFAPYRPWLATYLCVQ